MHIFWSLCTKCEQFGFYKENLPRKQYISLHCSPHTPATLLGISLTQPASTTYLGLPTFTSLSTSRSHFKLVCTISTLPDSVNQLQERSIHSTYYTRRIVRSRLPSRSPRPKHCSLEEIELVITNCKPKQQILSPEASKNHPELSGPCHPSENWKKPYLNSECTYLRRNMECKTSLKKMKKKLCRES